MSNNAVLDKSKTFAVSIVNLWKNTKNDVKSTLFHQLLRSGTSIGANVYEAQHAQSKNDFISKMNIALKEAYETEYWLDLLLATDYLHAPQADNLLSECRELRFLLISIIRSSKNEKQ